MRRATRTDASIVLALLVLAALAAALRDPAGGSDKDPRRTTFSDAPRGLHALHLLLGDVGVRARRAVSPQAPDAPTSVTLVIAEPSETITRREVNDIAAWVRAGGRLVVVGGVPQGAVVPPANALLAEFGLDQSDSEEKDVASISLRSPTLADGTGDVDWKPTWVPAARRGAGVEPVCLAAAGGAFAIVSVAVGEAGGEVVVVADAGFLENRSLGRADNAVLALRLLAGRDEVVFDEVHHGFSAQKAGRITSVLLAALVDTWPGRALLVALAAGLLYLTGAAVRFGRADAEPSPPRRSLAEHADALGRLLEGARAQRDALRLLAAGARRAVGQRTGIPAGLPPAEFSRRLRGSLAPGASEMADAIDLAERPGTVKDVQMAKAAANLALVKRRFLHGV